MDMSEFRYGIRERRTDGFGTGVVFARFMFAADRDIALKALRKIESPAQRLIPTCRRPKGERK